MENATKHHCPQIVRGCGLVRGAREGKYTCTLWTPGSPLIGRFLVCGLSLFFDYVWMTSLCFKKRVKRIVAWFCCQDFQKNLNEPDIVLFDWSAANILQILFLPAGTRTTVLPHSLWRRTSVKWHLTTTFNIQTFKHYHISIRGFPNWGGGSPAMTCLHVLICTKLSHTD